MEFPVNSGLPSLSLEEFSWLSRSQLWQKLPDFRGSWQDLCSLETADSILECIVSGSLCKDCNNRDSCSLPPV